MGIAKDLTGDYQHGLLTLTLPTLAAEGMMLRMRTLDGSPPTRK
jgi:hypothetical protein